MNENKEAKSLTFRRGSEVSQVIAVAFLEASGFLVLGFRL